MRPRSSETKNYSPEFGGITPHSLKTDKDKEHTGECGLWKPHKLIIGRADDGKEIRREAI